jgi:CTP synthase
VLNRLNLPVKTINLGDWKALINAIKSMDKAVTIGLIGKYTSLKDAYISVVEALRHAGYIQHTKINVEMIDALVLEEKDYEDKLSHLDGILIPGGFGKRGSEGKINAVGYARKNKIPFLGLCFGMQLAVIEFSRNVAGLIGASSKEFDPSTKHPIFDLLKNQKEGMDLGGTMRLGNYPFRVEKGTKTHLIYKKNDELERHRHR